MCVIPHMEVQITVASPLDQQILALKGDRYRGGVRRIHLPVQVEEQLVS